MIEELFQKLWESVIANRKVPPVILRVFEDPGVNSFALSYDYVVALEQFGKPLMDLYLQYRGRVYDLTERGIYLSPEIYDSSRHDRGNPREGVAALHCIRTLKGTNIRSAGGLLYAAKYWARHVSLAKTTDHSALEELWGITLQNAPPERRVTHKDALLVMEWLKVGSLLIVVCE